MRGLPKRFWRVVTNPRNKPITVLQVQFDEKKFWLLDKHYY